MAQPSREPVMPLEDSLQTVAFVAKSLADENRLRILLCINKGKKSVSGMVEELHLSQPLVSHHLKELRRSLLVKVERNGPFVYYVRVMLNASFFGVNYIFHCPARAPQASPFRAGSFKRRENGGKKEIIRRHRTLDRA